MSFRKLGDEYNLSGKQAYERVIHELKQLPNNFELTRDYCQYQSGILIMDGKYIKVRGYKQKIPFIYGIDYETHDILFGILSFSEDEKTFSQFFQRMKSLNYPLQIVVADDRTSLPLALKRVYPTLPLQLCLNHYLENIRTHLHIRTDKTHRYFFHSLQKHIFQKYEDDEKLKKALQYVFERHGKKDFLRQIILKEIYRRRKELFAYKTISNCPNNTNLIELFNSHLNARLKSIKGFKSFLHAELWLNAALLRRRTKSFTDCDTKFKHLNGKCSLELSLKKSNQLFQILPRKAPKR